jgi:hypothetical protein
MRRVVVQYRTKPERGDENQRLVEKVFDELAHHAPEGLRYAAFRMADGVSFMHVAFIEDADANPLAGFTAFAEFQRDLANRCDEPPAPRDMTVVGSYRVFAD